MIFILYILKWSANIIVFEEVCKRGRFILHM